jgi:ATP-binding cassette subfamily G (WHITE) protein 2 (PDR)
MYRVSPFTYLISAVLSVALANTSVTCSSIELLHLNPLPNTTCGSYMTSYIKFAGGYLTNPSALENCEFCAMADTNTFLADLSSNYDDRWRNFGILVVYVFVNVVLTIGLYWLVRVPQKGRSQTVEEGEVVVAKEGKSVGTIAIKSSCMKRAFCFLGSEMVG